MSSDESGQHSLVIVPSQAQRIVRLSEFSNDRGDVDVLLDEMFGPADDQGPGPADAALVGAGAVAVVAATVTALPAAVLVGGIGAIGLGAILPLRSVYRKVAGSRRQRDLVKFIGDGVVLNTAHPSAQQLVQSYETVLIVAENQPAAVAFRSRSVAHALVHEVATLLDGNEARTSSELAYVADRVKALDDLAARLAMPADEQARQAHVAARLEVESVAGSSALIDAADLLDDLWVDRGK